MGVDFELVSELLLDELLHDELELCEEDDFELLFC
jgi:hypothetical protein